MHSITRTGPTAFRAEAAVRRAMMFNEARELLTACPAQGEPRCIQSGNLDLMLLLMAILDIHPRLVGTCG